MIAQRALRRECTGVAVGFPGETRDGIVIDGANLVREDGPFSPRDEALDAKWRGFELAGEIRRLSRSAVVVRNDAHATAFGCQVTAVRSLVVVLGTGCGVGFVNEGELVDIRDYGDDLLGDYRLDQLVGEAMRRRGHEEWIANCNTVVSYLVAEINPDAVYLAGGNAGRLRPTDVTANVPVVVVRGEPAFQGLLRLMPRVI